MPARNRRATIAALSESNTQPPSHASKIRTGTSLAPRARGLIELNVAVVVFAGTAVFAKLIELPVSSIIFGRSAVAAGSLALYALIARKQLRLNGPRDALILLGLGGVLAVHWLSYFRAIQVSTVAVGTIALHTYPIMTVLVEPIFDRKRLHAADALLALVVLAGIIVLVPEFSLSSTVSQGVLWGVLSAILFTVRNLITRRIVQRFSGPAIMFYQIAVTALVLLPFVWSRGALPGIAREWQRFLVLGTVFTALAQSLYAASLRHLSAKTVSIIATLLPLYSAVVAIIVLGEIPTLRTILGGAIVVSAVLAETVRATRQGAGT